MSNAAKIMKDAKPKAPRQLRAKKVKADLNDLPYAVVDGKLCVKPEGKIVFQRTLDGKTKLHEGHIKDVVNDIVNVWDETRGQWWAFSLHQAEHVRAASVTELVTAPDCVPRTPTLRPSE